MMHTHDHTTDNIGFGFWVYLMSDCVLFASLFATYAVLSSETFGMPAVAGLASLPFVLWETLILLTSSFTVGLAMLFAAKAQKQQHSRSLGQALPAFIALLVTLGLGITFLSMEVYEFRHLIGEGHGPWQNASYSAFFTLVGTHGLHVFFGTVWGLLLVVQMLLWGVTDIVTRRLLCFSLFWHFLDVVWIVIFTFVYLFGALSL